MVEVAAVEKSTDLVKARSIEIGTTLGGVAIASIADLEMISVRLARGLVAVPIHCREQPGVCFALAMQALEWGMPIMSVINKSYVPRNGDRIGFESQLLHAVIEKNAPLKNRLRFETIGEGDERRCKVWGTFTGETEPHIYISETLGKLHPGHVTKDDRKFVKGSQLWDDNPEVQLFYSASRQWARLFCPDVLLGAYTPEEMQTAEAMVDVTPKVSELAQRLRDAKQAHASADRGFDAAHVEREANTTIEGEAKQEVTDGEASEGGERELGVEGRGGEDAGGSDGDRDQTARAGLRDTGKAVGAEPTRQIAAPAQAEIFPPDRDRATKPKGKPKAKR